VLALLGDHRELGIHTAPVRGFRRSRGEGRRHRGQETDAQNKVVTTSALGTRRLYEFLDENTGVEFWPVDHTNDPWVVAEEARFVAINGTLEVDVLGQCASESLGSEYWSSSGGQPDFARGAVAKRGQSFIVLHATTHDESVSRIVLSCRRRCGDQNMIAW
jgi:acyl-CoA hydrolase